MINALKDIGSGLINWRLWIMLALDDIRLRYHRTLLGPVWIVGSFVAFVAVKTFIFSSLAQANWQYFGAYLTLGYAAWTLLNNAVVDGSSCLVSSRAWVLGVKTSYTLFIVKTLASTVFNFTATMASALAISYWLHPFTPMAVAWSLLGVLVTIISLFWIQLFLATISVFMRDAIQFTQTSMRLLFFLSPVIWLPESLGSKAHLLDYNPFSHYLAIIRAPLLGQQASALNWYVVGGVTLGAIILSISVFAMAKRRIPAHI